MACSPEDLIYQANCCMEDIEEKDEVMPNVQYLFEIYKAIMDSLRQNSKMLDFYNSTVQRAFEFCRKYRCRREYKKISDSLHSHFAQIIKHGKMPETMSKIPFPVRLDEEGSVKKVLHIRYEQLKIALQMKEWSDAFRTSQSIYMLINKQKHNLSKMKQTLYNFFFHLGSIFWESQYFLFHAYSQRNLSDIIKSNKQIKVEEREKTTAEAVLAALSIPLDN